MYGLLLEPSNGASKRIQWLVEKGLKAAKNLLKFRGIESQGFSQSVRLKVLLCKGRFFLPCSQTLLLHLKTCNGIGNNIRVSFYEHKSLGVTEGIECLLAH